MRGHTGEGAGIMFFSSDDFRKVKVLCVLSLFTPKVLQNNTPTETKQLLIVE
jgi:hypothetical protein